MNVDEVNQIAYRVISENDLDLAEQFLQSKETQPQHSVWLLYKLTQGCRADQAVSVGYLLAEFVPTEASPGIGKFLRRHEFRMYQRLKNHQGVEKSLRRYVALSPEGRAFLRWLGKDGRLFEA
jgi:hypothetical protein